MRSSYSAKPNQGFQIQGKPDQVRPTKPSISRQIKAKQARKAKQASKTKVAKQTKASKQSKAKQCKAKQAS